MKRIGIYPTEKTPRSFNVDPHGDFLVVAGQDSDTLVVYRVQKDGSLDAIKRVPIGKTPWWVHFCDTNEKSQFVVDRDNSLGFNESALQIGSQQSRKSVTQLNRKAA